jgi:hypothetical protein
METENVIDSAYVSPFNVIRGGGKGFDSINTCILQSIPLFKSNEYWGKN